MHYIIIIVEGDLIRQQSPQSHDSAGGAWVLIIGHCQLQFHAFQSMNHRYISYIQQQQNMYILQSRILWVCASCVFFLFSFSSSLSPPLSLAHHYFHLTLGGFAVDTLYKQEQSWLKQNVTILKVTWKLKSREIKLHHHDLAIPSSQNTLILYSTTMQ